MAAKAGGCVSCGLATAQMGQTMWQQMHRLRQWASATLMAVLATPALAAAVCEDPASTMLWQVQGEALAGRSVSLHLLGSIHVGKADFYPLQPVVDERLQQADTLVFEVDPRSMASPAAALAIQQRGMLPADRTLAQELDAATLATLRQVLGSLGVPELLVMKMKPWMVTLTLTAVQVQMLGYDPANGVESYLMQHKPPAAAIGELESLDTQLALMESLDQRVFLNYALQDFASTTAQMEQLVAAWRCGAHDQLAEILFSVRDGEANMLPSDRQVLEQVMQRMFDQRNAQMATRIDQYLRSGEGDYFVVVGAGHLLGEGSVVDLLRQRGYDVTPVRQP